jgi:hypothetical protein
MSLHEVSALGSANVPVSAIRPATIVGAGRAQARTGGRRAPANPPLPSSRSANRDAPEALAENADFFIVSEEAADRYLLRAEEELRDRSGYGFLETAEEEGAAAPTSITRTEAAEIADEVLRTAATAKGSSIPRLLARAAGIPDASRPSANSSRSAATARSAVVTYDHGGRENVLDVYLSKIVDNHYELAGFDRAEAAPGGGFPYAAGPQFVESLIYDPNTGLMALVPIEDADRESVGGSPGAAPSFLRRPQGLIFISIAVAALLIVLVAGFTPR